MKHMSIIMARRWQCHTRYYNERMSENVYQFNLHFKCPIFVTFRPNIFNLKFTFNKLNIIIIYLGWLLTLSDCSKKSNSHKKLSISVSLIYRCLCINYNEVSSCKRTAVIMPGLMNGFCYSTDQIVFVWLIRLISLISIFLDT